MRRSSVQFPSSGYGNALLRWSRAAGGASRGPGPLRVYDSESVVSEASTGAVYDEHDRGDGNDGEAEDNGQRDY